MDLQTILQESSFHHNHLCPRQILGARLGLAGLTALSFDTPPDKKRLLVITETDGCFTDGLSAATKCTVGHRNLRVEDYGKIAATFVDVQTEQAIRIAPQPDVRQKALTYAEGESRRYFAQLQAYQSMPDDELLNIQLVCLNLSIKSIVSRAGVRVNCDVCGEEIINEREVKQKCLTLCRACAYGGYYHVGQNAILPYPIQQEAAWRVFN